MQREEEGRIVISCDFCRRDWDGAAAMIEGHHGSILCLECLQLALAQAAAGPEKYRCTLCLRVNIPGSLPHWRNPAHPEAMVCAECLHQAAGTFSKDPGVDWTWDGTKIKG